MLKERDKTTKSRIENAHKASELLRNFFDKGFKSLVALVAITQYYYPELDYNDIKNFWHFRNIGDETIRKMSDVFEKLKSE